MHNPPGLLGLREMHGVTAPRHEGCYGRRRLAGDPQGVRREADIVRSRHGQNRTAESREAVPQRHLSAGPAQPQARRESRRAVAEAFGAVGRLGGQSAEQRATQPILEKAFHVTRRLELRGDGLVRPAATCTRVRILYASGHADEDRMVQGQIRTRNDVKGDPGAQRIAEQAARLVADDCPHRLGHHGGRRRQIGPNGVRAGVTGKVHRDERVCLGQILSEASPEPTGLCESMQHDQRRPRAAHFGMEWHDG